MDLLELAIQAAAEASTIVMQFYGSDVVVKPKTDNSPVTQADLRSNEIIIQILKHTNIPVLSEESKDDLARLSSKRLWIIDPLDGTQDFIQKTDEFAVMIGLIMDGEPILGVIACPAMGKVYYAEKNKGAYVIYQGKTSKIHVSDVDNLESSRLVITRNHFSQELQNQVDKLAPLNVAHVGSNGLKIASVSEGNADFCFNPSSKLGEWDVCAPQIILEEAGGKLTDMEGKDIRYNKEIPNIQNGILASNGVLHREIIDRLCQAEMNSG